MDKEGLVYGIGVRSSSEVPFQKWLERGLIKRWGALSGKTAFQKAPHLARHL